MPSSLPKPRATMWGVIIVSIGVLLVALLLVGKSMQREAESWQWVVHTREVLERLQSVLTRTSEAEAAQRGFLLSGAEQHLASFRQAAAAVPPDIAALQQSTIDNPTQQQAIRTLQEQVAQRLAILQQALQMKLAGEALDPALLASGLRQKQLILELAAKIKAEEESLLLIRQDRVQHARAELILAVGALFVLSIGLLVFLRVMSERDAERLRAESTQLKEAQRQLREANELLEQRIQERTRQIADANAELQAFAHTVAHDLRAPLRNVEGFASALLEDEVDRMSDEGKVFAARISAAVVRMDRLITDLLAYSRLSRSELQLQRVDLGHVMQAVVRDLESQIRESRAEVVIEEPLPTVKGNEGVLAQIMSNLLSNAIKFVPPGIRPRVHVFGDMAEGMGRIVVEDSGIGIDPVHHQRVFGVFERLHGQEQYPGTGIGLAIVRKGAERMGGSARVENTPDGGARFEVLLPAV
jgi:signal transduction histidine kinase